MHVGELTYLDRPYRFTVNDGILRLNHLDNAMRISMVPLGDVTGEREHTHSALKN